VAEAPDNRGMASPAALALPDDAPAPADAGARARAREALLGVINLRVIAATFFVVLLVVASYAPWHFIYSNAGALDATLQLVRYLRQSLITAYLVLIALGIGQALAAAGRWSITRTLVVSLALIVLGALVSMFVRVWLAGASLSEARAPYWLAVLGLWVFIGGLACVAFWQRRQESAERAALAQLRRSHDQLEAQRCEAQLAALNAQIEPHFLFNTLANVKRLYEISPARGREMMASLIEYLRAALPLMRSGGSTLGRELELVGAFLSILKMRMGERLDFHIRAAPTLHAARVPPLVLPTLVENAVKHGLSPLPAGGQVEIGAEREGDTLLLWVQDNGAGFSGSGGAGVGLANTRARLAALYGPRASLALRAATPRGVRAEVRLPWSEAA
jgi:sensor histidine kinase YesM